MRTKILTISAIVLGAITVMLLAALAIIYFGNSGDYTVMATTADDPTLPAIEVDGYRFHGETFGNPANPVLIMLHGGPGSDYRYILPMKKLADEYFVVFYDQRGSGLSPRVEAEEHTLEQYISDLHSFAATFSPDEKFYLVGHSWGAMLASSYLGQHPERIEKVVLAEPGFLDASFRKEWMDATGLGSMSIDLPMLISMISSFGKALHVNGPDSQARQDFFMGEFFSGDATGHPLSGYYVDNDMRNAAGEDWRFSNVASSTMQNSVVRPDGSEIDFAQGVGSYSGEVLFIAGSENEIIGPEYQLRQMERFPDARLEIIEGAGHTMFGEKPEESMKVIRAYFER